MRVLVTGGAGFLGWHVVQRLLAEGHEPFLVDDLSTGVLANVSKGVWFKRGDVREPLDDLMRVTRPEVVVHLAAQVSVPQSINRPDLDLSVNVGGTVNVVLAAARCGARKVVAVSSGAVYGIPTQLPISEEHPKAVLSPYGLSKLTGEQYIELLAPQLALEYTILRPANIYGPWQRAAGEGAVVPAFLSRFLRGESPVIHGNGTQTRDFIFAADMARAIVQALRLGDGKILNTSTGKGATVNELWHMMAQLVGWSDDPVYGPPRLGDIPHSVLANYECIKHLNWEPTVPLEVGLAETVAWSQSAEAVTITAS